MAVSKCISRPDRRPGTGDVCTPGGAGETLAARRRGHLHSWRRRRDAGSQAQGTSSHAWRRRDAGSQGLPRMAVNPWVVRSIRCTERNPLGTHQGMEACPRDSEAISWDSSQSRGTTANSIRRASQTPGTACESLGTASQSLVAASQSLGIAIQSLETAR